MAVEQEETKEENKITHQPSQEEEIPRDRQQGVQMYDRVFRTLLYSTPIKMYCTYDDDLYIVF